MNANMQAHRRKKKKRPVFSYMRNIRSVFLQADDLGKFGFTLSGQQPCILSSIVKNSPADIANVKSGDFLISVNGKSVWHMSHEEIVELIGTSEYRIRITIADNYFSDSSDEEDGGGGSQQFRYRPKYPYSKSRTNRTQASASTSSFDSPHHSRIPPRFHTHPPLPYIQHSINISSLRNDDVSVSAVLKTPSSSNASAAVAGTAAATSSSIMIANTTVSIIVGYLGTIEIPKQIATSSKLQTVRSCIRKMRQEKRSPTLVLMNILPNSLNLLNSNNVILATYPASRLNYISSSSDNNSKFFGLVTSARLSHEDDTPPFDSYDSLKMRTVEIAITNSCHVFGIETKLIDHNAHLSTAEKFKITCTKDLISNSCLEFPTTSDYICNIIRSMYNIKSPEKADAGMNSSVGMKLNQIQRRNNHFNDPHELLLPNSPHPSNHSEITTSSNSDSGIGFHNDLKNISDRILVVDFPDQNHCALNIHNKNLNLQRQRKSRPLGIVNDYQLQENAIRNIRTMHQPSSSPRVENVFHAKSKSADYNYENVEKLAIRAMPLRSVSNSVQQELNNEDYENVHPKAVTDVWYDGEMLDEDGNEIHERAIDVTLEKQISVQSQSNIMIRSCDDILMIMDSEEAAMYQKDNENEENKPIEDSNKKDHVFLMPARPQKRHNHNNKRSLTLLGKSKSSHEESKSKHESNLKHYKLSPKVFGLARPVSISVENLSTTASTSTTTTKRRSLFGSKKKESKNAPTEEEFSIWGSLQELRNCENLKQEKQTNFLEGTYSEPNLNYDDESKQSQSDLSSFKRWGQSSLRARDERVRPSSLTASESDVYTKLTDAHKDTNRCFTLGPASWGQSFEFLLNDPNGLKIFAEFLKKEFSGENIYFWTACERYRQITDEVERRKEAIAIYEKHLGNGAHEPVNVDSNARNCTRDGLSKAELDLFSSAQKQIFNLMKFDSYQRFIRSELYKSCIQAEQKNTSLPYASENLDPLLKITLSNSSNQAAAAGSNNSNNSVSSKLKKSLSNAEDRRRKSLLPWHRKTRCKSKDREEENKKNSTSSSNTLKHNSNHSDLHSSRSSLSSFDAAIAKISSFDDETRNSLCRVILRENGATTIVQIKHDETIRELVERVLDKRGFSYQAYEVFLSGTNKPLDLDAVSKELAGNEVFIEQRVVFKLDLPNRKVISVKSKPSKLLCEVLRPILHKYNYRLDMVHAYAKETNDLIDTSLQVTDVDGMRLLILFKDDCGAAAAAANSNVTEVGQKHVLHNFNMRNAPVTFVRANKLVSSVSNPQLNTLDEITNKVFNEVLQCKSTAESELSNGANRNCDEGSIKSEDWGSETETSSGIFNRIRRHKKPQKTTVAVAVGNKNSAGSESDVVNGLKKPLIAKWKAGNQKLQVTNRNPNDGESLLENLKRAQCLRIEDQRGTDINFELPDFLKDRNKFSGQKLRKTTVTADEVSSNLYSNIDSLSPQNRGGDFNKMNVSPSQQKPPQPLPRTSLGNKSNSSNSNHSSPLKSSPEISSVQSKINSLENAILMSSSRSNTPINMNVSTACLPSTTPIIKNRHSDEFYSENYGVDTTMIFNHNNHRDSYYHHQENNDYQHRLSQSQKESPPKLPPKRNFYKMIDVMPPPPSASSSTNQPPEIYLDQPSSSFV